jgi:L-methionine (R)-S-oxide reductase
MTELKDQITLLLKGAPDHATALQLALSLVLARFQSETGTIHTLDHEAQCLHLAAQIGLPPAMLEVVKTIPVGKGIAGEVIARGGPVTICNLQTDASGVAKPGARQTGVGGALCVPLRQGETIIGTIGVGTARAHEYSPEQTTSLEQIGQWIGECIAQWPPAH